MSISFQGFRLGLAESHGVADSVFIAHGARCTIDGAIADRTGRGSGVDAQAQMTQAQGLATATSEYLKQCRWLNIAE